MISYFRPHLIFFLFSLTILFGRNYASFAGGFLRMGSSARSMAMGSGFTAEIDAGFSAYHNPASMVFPKPTSSASNTRGAWRFATLSAIYI